MKLGILLIKVGKKLQGRFLFYLIKIRKSYFLDGLNLKKRLKVVVDGVNHMLLHYHYIHYLNYVIIFLMEVLYLTCKLINYQP
jgi:hypothetical protein